MDAREELLADNARKVAHRFFLKIGQAKRAAPTENPTLPLFGLPLILEADGKLSRDYEYLARCEDAIRRAAQEMRA